MDLTEDLCVLDKKRDSSCVNSCSVSWSQALQVFILQENLQLQSRVKCVVCACAAQCTDVLPSCNGSSR